RISSARSPGRARSTAITPTTRPADTFSPPTTRRAWWCGRMRPRTMPRPTRMRWQRRTSSGLPASPASPLGGSGPICRVPGAGAGENIFAHLALLNALDLRLRTAEIVVAGQGARADDLLAAARKLPFVDRIVLRASPALPASHPAQDKIKAATEPAAFVCVGE